MEFESRKINCMFVQHTVAGIDLYGAFSERDDGPVVVYKSTKNQEEVPQQLYGEKYTNEYLREKLKTRKSHNFIGYISGPISMPIDEKKVIFMLTLPMEKM